jgi:methionine aminotransferase
VTITLGATEALFSAIAAFVGAGEEAILFDPAYDSYAPAVKLAGGRARRIPLTAPDFRYDWDRVRDSLTPRTRLIVLNTPHNPSCTAASAADIEALAELTRDRPIVVIGDEVYEHVLFDGRRHISLCAHPELSGRSISVFSFGKMLHATGLRVGYCVAPEPLMREVRKVHQFNTFSIAHPFQHAIAQYLDEKPQAWRELSAFFQAKRDRLCTALSDSPFSLPPAEGTYFQLLDYSALSNEPDAIFAERLLSNAGVATIPLSPFYEQGCASTLLRLCIAKRDATLDAACERLRHFAHEA